MRYEIAIALSLILLLIFANLPLLGEIDLELVRTVQEHGNPLLDLLFLLIYFSFYPFVPLYLCYICRKGRASPYLIPLLAFLAVTYLVVRPLNIFGEKAPRFIGARDVISQYVPSFMHSLWGETWCFPSEHLVITSFIAFVSRKRETLAYFILTWISTVYIGDHYFTDILVNGLVGLILSQIAQQIQRSTLTSSRP